MLNWKSWTILSILVGIGSSVAGHGRLIDPPARSAMWRFNYTTRKNINDNSLFCGGYKRYIENKKRCGICGESWDSDRDYDGGGRYATGIIVRNYTIGQVINVTVDLTANHLGYFIFRICPHNNYRTPAKQKCLDKHPLGLADGSGTKVKVHDYMNLEQTFSLRLPADITCEQCVFQWSYYTALTGELYQNCADVSIRESQKSEVTKPGKISVTCKAIGKMKGKERWCKWFCRSGKCWKDFAQYCICFLQKI